MKSGRPNQQTPLSSPPRGAPGMFSDLLKSVQMLKREWGAESNGKLPHLFIPSKTATLVPEFAVEDLPLSRTTALVPEFAVKDLPLGRTLIMKMATLPDGVKYPFLYICKNYGNSYLNIRLHIHPIIIAFTK